MSCDYSTSISVFEYGKKDTLDPSQFNYNNKLVLW